MRPIMLTIKGLNSFIEKQVIDFNRLTSRGLFGIFGSTGSGKSTILDGMTLALYGEMARKSSNFINTNCNSASVIYEFQIREKELRHYIVEREFRRNKEGGINSKLAKITEVINGEPHVIEEMTTRVNKKIIEILGLNCEDFTRTVVLPQGKFSEFLKLDGKPRRDMLERLFALHKYGDELSSKLSKVIRVEKSNYDKLQGKLSGYEDISEDIYKDKEKQLEVRKLQERETFNNLQKTKEKFDKSKLIWDLQNELRDCYKKREELLKEKHNVEKGKVDLERSESALRIKPNIDSFNKIDNNVKEQNKNLEIEKNKKESIVKDREEANKRFDKISIIKEERYDKLLIIESKLSDGLKEEEAVKNLEEETKKLRAKWSDYNKNKEILDKEIVACDKDIESIKNLINNCEENLKHIKIDEDYKEKVINGLSLEEKLYKDILKEKELKNNIEKNQNKIKDKCEELSRTKTNILELQGDLDKCQEELKNILNNNPGNEDDLLKSSEEIKKLEGVYKNLGEFKEERDPLLKENEKLVVQGNRDIEEVDKLREEVDKLDQYINKLERENLAEILREGLVVGEPCPVCGATHSDNNSIENSHLNSKKIDIKEINSLKKDHKEKEKSLRDLEIKLEGSKTKFKFNENAIIKFNEKIQLLEEDIKNKDLEDLRSKFNNLKANIEKYNKSKEDLEEKIKKLQKIKGKLDVEESTYSTFIEENNKRLEELTVEYENLSEERISEEEKLEKLKAQLDINNIKDKYEEIKSLENKAKELEKSIVNNRNVLQDKEKLYKELQDKKSCIVEDMARIQTMGSEKAQVLKDKISKIEELKEGRESLSSYKFEVDKKIKYIDNEFKESEKLKKYMEEEFEKCNRNINSLENTIKELSQLKNDLEENIEKQLKKEGFSDREEAVKSLLEENEMASLKSYIDNYEDTVKKINNSIENLLSKIDGKDISEEQWVSINEELKNAEKLLEEMRKQVTTLSNELSDIKEKLKLFKSLLKEKEKLEHKLSILNDLENLFKGKKFVEFVASHQLKYISMQASKRLIEISGGDYGLELDDASSKFIIRDYKNGGAIRDASTLSGGETFLTSLALALALSSQIQLKGTAPLELFFLDEGFGTLDTNLLDTVMQSLEKIHNNNLSVGIISHVEEIKNRVPVKLMVEPAVAGLGGSKVKIENS